MSRNRFLLIFLIALLCPSYSHAQAWSGVIAPTRATDWSHAGVTGGIPSASWTQCGATIAAYSGNTDKINSAIAACGANQFVMLGPGTFNLTAGSISGGIAITKSNVVLRGSGANSTFLVMGSGAYDSCTGGYHAAICLNGGNGAYWVQDPAVAWTAGYARGTTVITLASVAGIVPNSTIVALDQCSDGNSGTTCSQNPEVDNGGYFNCDIGYTASGTGCAVNGPDGGNQRSNRPQTELFQVSSVNTSTNQVTLIGSLRSPDWNTAQTPMATIAQVIQHAGIENLSIDTTSEGATMGITLYYTAQSWIHGVRIIQPNYSGVWVIMGAHDTIEQNYMYSTSHLGSGADIFGYNSAPSSDNLFQANICQYDEVCYGNEGGDTGSVIAYNFFINDFNANGGLYPTIFPHAGDHWQLYEGNAMNSYFGENYHGPKLMQTLFRNFITGWESCANGNCGTALFKGGGGNATTPVRMMHHSRFHNVIGNVLGTPGYHNSYSTTNGFSDLNIFEIGSSDVAPTDPIVGTTLFRYGNWDVVTNGTRFCGSPANTGWGTTCGSTSEVPTTFSPFGQPLPTVGDTGAGQPALPPSFYLSGKPSWFGSLPFPAIGPDVTSGNVGQCKGAFGPQIANLLGQFGGVAATSSAQCSGTSLTTTAWGGHVNTNPAMNCFLNVMGGKPDGTGSVLSFNASSCYGAPAGSPGGPAPATSLIGTGH